MNACTHMLCCALLKQMQIVMHVRDSLSPQQHQGALPTFLKGAMSLGEGLQVGKIPCNAQ